MPDSAKAVFLSYAREDIAAARRIADSLRAFGVEVWFDENELRGGDAWDAKIRGQIRACALFVPLVSQHTQARSEGYFRREWRLGVDRTFDMVAGAAFIVPVVIDDTLEGGNAVPEEFTRYQWTRLPHGVPTPQFVEQVKRLLEAPRRQSGGQRTDDGRQTAEDRRGTANDGGRRTDAARSSRARWLVGATIVVAVGIAGFFALRPANESVDSPSNSKPQTPNSERSNSQKTDAKSIAVLPFANLSDDRDSGFFADGIHEDILTSLYLIPDLKVTSRTSVGQYRDTKKSMRQIGQELGVTYILEGSVRRDGKTVRVTSQLIRAGTDEHLWAKHYDKELKDLFAIQSELAQAIADELQARLSPQAKKILERRPTENVAAYDLFLKARENRNSSGSGRTAIEKQENLLQAAVVLDPKFAPAWAELARLHAFNYGNFRDHSAARLAKAKAAIDTAVRLEPDAPDVILNLGYYRLFAHHDYAAAAANFERVGRLQPNDPLPGFALASARRRQGRMAVALEGFRAVAQLDLANLDLANQVQNTAAMGRRWDMVLAERRRMYAVAPNPRAEAVTLAELAFWARGSSREMEAVVAGLPAGDSSSQSASDALVTLALMRGDHAGVVRAFRPRQVVEQGIVEELARVRPVATALAAQGELPGARTRLESFPSRLRTRLELEPENADLLSSLGTVEAILGHTEEALRCARRAVELIPESVDAVLGPYMCANLAFVYAWTGDKESALVEYTRLLGVPVYPLHAGGEINVHVMMRHPDFFPLQADPRFQALLADPKNNAPLF